MSSDPLVLAAAAAAASFAAADPMEGPSGGSQAPDPPGGESFELRAIESDESL